jgi:hypothetical protein
VEAVFALTAEVCEPRITGESDCEDEAQPPTRPPLITAEIKMKGVLRIT